MNRFWPSVSACLSACASGRGRVLAVLLLPLVLGACAETQFLAHMAKQWGDGADGIYKVGKPYQINGVWYYPKEDFSYDETGIASWYGPGFHSKRTANGETYDQNDLTAAHRTLPMPSFVRVSNLENGRSLILRINDRGPFARGRIIDVSKRAAQLLDMQKQGTARVRVQVLEKESRAVAARYRAGQPLAKGESPITVAGLPKPEVQAESLPPPPGSTSAPASQTQAPPSQVAANQTYVFARADTPEPVLGQLETKPVSTTRLFVQAGAFAYYENANRVAAVLSKMGDVRISSVLINGTDLFRVRVGPIGDVKIADRLLDKVITAGYPDARIIVD